MIRSVILILLLFISLLYAGENKESGISGYKTIAVAPPQIAQIYTNPNLSDDVDVDLSSENQIKLFEEFGDNLCQTLAAKSDGSVEFLCYDEIRLRLKDAKSWDNFNRFLNGQSIVNEKISRLFAERLKAEGAITSTLLFSYYEQPQSGRHIEVYYEWNLINLMSGKSDTSGNYSRGIEITESELISGENEYACFEAMSERFIDYFVNLLGFDREE